MKKFIIFLLTTFFIIISLWIIPDIIRYYNTPLQDKLVNKRIFAIGGKIGKEKNLNFGGFGGGLDENKKEKLIAISFYYRGAPYTLNNARKLMLYCIETSLEEINNDEEIREYLCQFPFKPENLKIAIYFADKEGSTQKPPLIACIAWYNNHINYRVNTDPNTYYEETLQKSKILNQKNL